MNYVVWSVLAFVCYSLFAPLLSIATTGTPRIPSLAAAAIANSMLVVVAAAVTVQSGGRITPYLTSPKAPYLFGAGICLTVGILSYYKALGKGPVSVVSPIFGMFLVGSSIVGIVALNESLTARKALGIGLAVVAVYLVAAE
ncbi:MAG: EamA family transporter [Haloferacaceae archaeon]